MLVAIVAALIGLLGTAVGIPLYLMDGNIRDLRAEVRALADIVRDLGHDLRESEGRTGVRFAEQDAKFEARFAEQDAKIEARFTEQDAKFEARFAEQAAEINARFAEQDVKIEARFTALEQGQAEIDRKLTALIAHLNTTDAVEAALEGRIE